MKLYLYNCTKDGAARLRPKGSIFTLQEQRVRVISDPEPAFSRGQPDTGPWWVRLEPLEVTP